MTLSAFDKMGVKMDNVITGREIFLCKGFTQATPTNPFTSIVD